MDAHYALANVLDQRPPYELSRLSDTYVLPRPQSKAQVLHTPQDHWETLPSTVSPACLKAQSHDGEVNDAACQFDAPGRQSPRVIS